MVLLKDPQDPFALVLGGKVCKVCVVVMASGLQIHYIFYNVVR